MAAATAKRLGASAFRLRAAEVVARLRGEVGAFAPSDPPQPQRLARAAGDPLYFCSTYLPHYFSQPFAPFHRELIELLTPRGRAVVPVVVAAPGASPRPPW